MTNPGYRDVCSGETDHAEALRIEFDPTIVSYADLVGKSFYRLATGQALPVCHRILLSHA